jgi:hypothetical protein
MSYYRHTQIGTLLLGVLGASMLLIGAILLAGGRREPLLVVLAILAVTAVLFASLTVEIQAEVLTMWFGPGLIRKRVPLATIRSCAVVRNSWWYGWGIRLTPHGWLYNVSGLAAVELTLQDGRRLRIGTDEPEQLCQAIGQAQSGAQALSAIDF